MISHIVDENLKYLVYIVIEFYDMTLIHVFEKLIYNILHYKFVLSQSIVLVNE